MIDLRKPLKTDNNFVISEQFGCHVLLLYNNLDLVTLFKAIQLVLQLMFWFSNIIGT